MIEFECPNCQKRLRMADEFGGRKVKCPQCGTRLEVPLSVADRLAPPESPAAHDDHAEDGRLFPPKHAEDEELIDMTAMVDIVFFLLIFFLVTSLHSLQASIEMPTPDPQDGSSQGRVTVEAMEQNHDYVIARIDKDNTIWINDVEASTRQEVIAKLRDAREVQEANSLVVMPSPDCHHEFVVMVLDAGASAGIENVRLANLGSDEL